MIPRNPLVLAAVLLSLAACASGGSDSEGATADAVQSATVADTSGSFAPEPGFNTEEYAHVAENGFRDARATPLSTFAIDVDRASYANVRRFLRQGQMPPADAVRIEELVNYFEYDDPDPAGDEPFAVRTEVADAPWNPEHRLVRIGIQGRRMDVAELPPSNLVFLVDVSGSMEPDLPLVKAALGRLVEEMGDEDRVGIVVYAGAAGVVLEPTSDRRRIMRALDDLQAGGSTAGGEGIRLAYRLARDAFVGGGNNRVILATDGDFNVGVTSEGELVRLIEQEREDGIFLTVLGFGTGNLADARMEALADHGNGNYAYVDGEDEAEKVLVRERAGTLVAIAKDVKVQVEFNPARVDSYRLIGYENRVMAAEDFNDDRKDAGELGAGHTVTVLYEVVPAGGSREGRRVDPLRYQDRRGGASGELMTVKLRYKQPEGGESRLLEHTVRDSHRPLDAASNDLRFAAAVAQWGMLLRGSEHAGQASYERVLRLARGAVGRDAHGDRAEFVRLVQSSRRLASQDGWVDEEEPWAEDDAPSHGH
ncbi:MAG TPA: VWA domain-containing protein [Longimicrobium sp.]|jgi:Ca-activated chloride channel family protein|uniref:vWA domain-containing protein n=1 Tax=Longimicrobium sp. TaxID=2029185 RepID=UPI002ED97E20